MKYGLLSTFFAIWSVCGCIRTCDHEWIKSYFIFEFYASLSITHGLEGDALDLCFSFVHLAWLNLKEGHLVKARRCLFSLRENWLWEWWSVRDDPDAWGYNCRIAVCRNILFGKACYPDNVRFTWLSVTWRYGIKMLFPIFLESRSEVTRSQPCSVFPISKSSADTSTSRLPVGQNIIQKGTRDLWCESGSKDNLNSIILTISFCPNSNQHFEPLQPCCRSPPSPARLPAYFLSISTHNTLVATLSQPTTLVSKTHILPNNTRCPYAAHKLLPSLRT